MNLLTKSAIAALAVAVVATGATVHAKDRNWGFGQDGAKNAHFKRDGGHDSRRGMGRIEEMMEAYDQNEDGALTQEEIDAVRAARLQAFDADGNGALNLEEYQALWLDAMNERMVDRFQSHDDDGNGEITLEEFGERQSKIVSRMDRNDDGKIDKTDFENRRQMMRERRGSQSPDASE